MVRRSLGFHAFRAELPDSTVGAVSWESGEAVGKSAEVIRVGIDLQLTFYPAVGCRHDQVEMVGLLVGDARYADKRLQNRRPQISSRTFRKSWPPSTERWGIVEQITSTTCGFGEDLRDISRHVGCEAPIRFRMIRRRPALSVSHQLQSRQADPTA